MSSVLSDLMQTSREEELALGIMSYEQTKNPEIFENIRAIVEATCTRNQLKLCWKKYCYIALTKKSIIEQWATGKGWTKTTAPAKIILASELVDGKSWNSSQCYVYKAGFNRGKKERRGQWFKAWRGQDNPVLTSGWEFADYDIYRIPLDLFNYLYNFLPKSPSLH